MEVIRYNSLSSIADIVIDLPIDYYHKSGVFIPQARGEIAHTSNWPDHCTIFIKTDLLEPSLALLKTIDVKFHLLTGSSDIFINTRKHVVSEIIQNEKILSWAGNNLRVEHAKMMTVPIGLEESQRRNRYNIARLFECDTEKDINVLATYTGRTSVKRIEFEDFLNQNIQRFDFIFRQHERLDYSNYVKQLNRSHYVLCPEGNGYDTLRLYESILAGSIPVVLENPIMDMHRDLGCVVLQSWDQIADLPRQPVQKIDRKLVSLSYWRDRLYEFQYHRSL